MTDRTCISPGAVTSDDLIAHLDDNATELVDAHLQACASCRAEARSLAETQRSFRTVLRRFDCPCPQQIGEYELGLVDPEQRQQLAAHVVDCPRCTEELATMRAFLADRRDLEPRSSRSPFVVIAELLAPRTQLAMAGFRGSEDDQDLAYRAGEVTITVGPGLGSRVGRWSVVGLILSESGELEADDAAEIQLTQADDTVATTNVDDLGNFVFDDVRAGRYGLRLLLADRTIVVENVRIGVKE